jgi:exosortase/archaeosortase family protein
MAGIFFGELYRLLFWRRLALVSLGLAWGILLNFARTSLLTWIAATRGAAAEAAWHDAMGLASLVIALAGILALAFLFAGKVGSMNAKGGISSTPSHDPQSATLPAPHWFSRRAILFIALWLVLIETFSEIWYRSREMETDHRESWTVTWPGLAQGFARQELSDEVLSLLRCDHGETGVWTRSDGSQWTMFFIKWRPGRMAAQLARGHTPDVCMTRTGYTMMSENSPVVLPLSPGGARLPFQSYVFRADGKMWYVFFCLQEDRVAFHAPLVDARDEFLSELAPSKRYRAAWEGRRFHGQQVFEIAMSGYHSLQQASAALAQSLPQLAHVTAK